MGECMVIEEEDGRDAPCASWWFMVTGAMVNWSSLKECSDN